jgi:hypothetical protein
MLAISKEDRKFLVPYYRSIGMSQRAISAATGTGLGTVHRDLASVPNGPGGPDRITGVNCKCYPSTQPALLALELPGSHYPVEVAPDARDAAPKPSEHVKDDRVPDNTPVPEAPESSQLDARHGRPDFHTHTLSREKPEIIPS